MVVPLSYVSLLLKANVRDVFGFIDKQNQADPSVWHVACQFFLDCDIVGWLATQLCWHTPQERKKEDVILM